MKKKEKIINELNQHLFDVCGNDVGHRFNYHTDGIVEIICFDEVVMYNSEDEYRELSDLKLFVKVQFNDYVRKINKMRFSV